MKKHILYLTAFWAAVFCQNGQAQNASLKEGERLFALSYYDSAIVFLEKAAQESASDKKSLAKALALKSAAQIEMFRLAPAMKSAEESVQAAKSASDKGLEARGLLLMGKSYFNQGNYTDGQKYYTAALTLLSSTEKQKEDFLTSAQAKEALGVLYFNKYEYANAMTFLKEALQDAEKTFGEGSPESLPFMLSLGDYYLGKGSHTLALDYYKKAADIGKALYGEKHDLVASAYVGIGDVNRLRGAYEVATDYYNYALLNYNSLFKGKHPKKGKCHLGLGDVHKNREEHKDALKEFNTALDIYMSTIGEANSSAVAAYLGIGNTYMYQEKYKDALEFYNKVLEINYMLVGEYNPNNAAAYNNMASVYYYNADYATALKYFDKGLKISTKIYGDKHPDVANTLYNIGRLNAEKANYDVALEYGQKAINASIIDFDDINVYVNPRLLNFYDQNDLLWYLKFKAETLEAAFDKELNIKGLNIALEAFMLCDTLVQKIRQSHISDKDKVHLGKTASQIYSSAVKASYTLYANITEEHLKEFKINMTLPQAKEFYKRMMFMFSEKNKAAVLSASLAETKAKAFGGIPDSLLHNEEELKKNIAHYVQELAAKPDSVTRERFETLLFTANRDYENLIKFFETTYPKYYQLKYDISLASVEDVQTLLDPKTALISYFVTDQHIYSNIIFKDKITANRVDKDRRYDKYITGMRNGIVYQVDQVYKISASYIFEQLFPDGLPEGIENLVVITDGLMSVVPFEALLTEAYDGDDYSEMPYLVKSCNISYVLSANLFHSTFKKAQEDAAKPDDRAHWIAYAPVFADEKTGGMHLKTQNILDVMEHSEVESEGESGNAKITTRGKLISGGQVTPIPGTEDEVKAIFAKFDTLGFRAQAFTHAEASEELIKKGGLRNHKFIHVATHGFVNEEVPELSGILLAQNADSKEDGVLYAGEIFNLILDADLITLSACETGLGKISKGEGVIGLTRALIYAGTKNVMVSLWKVSDESTAELMVDFYEEVLKSEGKPGTVGVYNRLQNYIRLAKLKMIANPEFAKPYYWSPFILNGF